MSWSLDQSPRTPFTEVSDLFAQTLCLQQPLHDGETYDVWIRATDIMDNTNVSSMNESFVKSKQTKINSVKKRVPSKTK